MKSYRHTYQLLLSGLLLCTLALLASCKDKATGEVVSTDKKKEIDRSAPYVEGNKRIMQWENEEMQLFIKRYGWNMQRTGTGLYIQILNSGQGEQFKEGDEVTLEYKTFLLDGTLLYDSDSDSPKTFTVCRAEEIDGLHEAVQMLRPGAKARLVIPSYLAYGVAGDGDKVNGRLSIAMTIEITNK